MRFNFSKILRLFNPPPIIGGLEVSDAALRFLLIEDGQIKKGASVNLPTGTLSSGKIVNDKNLIEAFRNLRSQVCSGRRPLPVIVSLPSASVYTQIFNLPFLETSHLEEAAKLNLQMISPLKRESVYSDWQIVGETTSGSHEVLGAFIDSDIVDRLVAVLKRSGFLPVALEFSSISLARFIKERSQLDLTRPYLILNLSVEGIDFSVINGGNLFFNHFISWPSTEQDPRQDSGQVTFDGFKKVVASELKKITNLYGNRWGVPLADILLFSNQPTKEIIAWLQSDFSMAVSVVDRYQDLDNSWFVTMGAALRGLISRAEDRFISLTKVGTEEEFLRSRICHFLSIWRTVIVSMTVLVVVLFVVLDLILIGFNKKLLTELGGTRVPVNQQEIVDLENEAKIFNNLVEKGLTAEGQAKNWSSFLAKIIGLAGSQISITQLDFNPATGLVNLVGNAKNERSISVFKNALINDPGLTDVNLPLATIVPGGGGISIFSTSFKIKPTP